MFRQIRAGQDSGDQLSLALLEMVLGIWKVGTRIVLGGESNGRG